MHAEARDARGGEGFELQVGWGWGDEGGGERRVEVGDAELNMRHVTRERCMRFGAR